MSFSQEELLQTIAQNVNYFRRKRKWSQLELSEKSKVSLRMIGLIENASNNVSLAILGNIASALRITFSELISPINTNTESSPITPHHGIKLWQGHYNNTVAELLQSHAVSEIFELWQWTIAPGDAYQGESDLPGSKEVIYIISGELTLDTEEKRYVLKQNECMTFLSDKSYKFSNFSNQLLTFTLNVIK